MKSKTNKRIKRVKKTLRTRRKLKKMRGGLFARSLELWNKHQTEKMNAYCIECKEKCNNRPSPPADKVWYPPPMKTANGWYIKEEHYPDYGNDVTLHHDDLKDVKGETCFLRETTNQLVLNYRLSIDKLPIPGEYKVDDDGRTVSLICHHPSVMSTKNPDRLLWVGPDNKEYPFDIENPLSITIDGVKKTLVKQ